MLGNRSIKGAHLVVGPAGSGKTTLLRERYVSLVQAGEQGILFLVHSKRAARGLQERILGDVGHSTDQVRVSTWHSFSLSLLRAHYRRLDFLSEPGLLTNPEQFALVREMLDEPGEAERWGDFRAQTKLTGFVQELREFVLRAQDALCEPDDLSAEALKTGRPELGEAARFYGRYRNRMTQGPLVDHARVLSLAVTLMRAHSDIADEVRSEARHILVDEYQDVTPAQETLLRELAVGVSSMVVAANAEARVFGFRGSREDAVAAFCGRFEPVETTTLTESHRTPARADAWLFDHLSQEAAAIAHECRRLRARDGIGYGETAVIVRRYGAAARAVRRAFEHAGVPYVVVGENRPLADEPALQPMLDCARAALREDPEREDLLPGLLASPVVGLDPYDVRALRREARLRTCALGTLVDQPPDDLPERLRAALLSLRDVLAGIRERQEKRPDEVFWFLWENLAYFNEMVSAGAQEDLDAVAAFARAIGAFSDRQPGKTFASYLDVLDVAEFGAEPWNMPIDRRPDAVRIMTAHHSVGTEFAAVIVAGCVEGEFPAQRDTRSMLDIRDVLRPRTPFERQTDRLAEERRLFGVAISRATRRLVVTAARESSQRQALIPSPLPAVAGMAWTTPTQPEPLTPLEAEATARRTARDQSASPEERRAAIDLLARLPGVDPSTWWYERDWTESDAPIVPEELRTSYTRLSNYDSCGLKYLFQVELGLDPETTHAMRVGTWVHDIVDRCQQGAIAATREALWQALDDIWDPSIFGSTAIEHRRKLDSRDMLRRWLATDAETPTTESEVAFEFPIQGATMRGRIDRIVPCGAGVRVIDYKTGRNAKSPEELVDDLQLATYFLALKRDPNLVPLGEPRYLELAYLGASSGEDGFKRTGLQPSKNPNYESETLERLEGIVAGIRAEQFAPNPDADCTWCRFKSICPVWPEGDEVSL